MTEEQQKKELEIALTSYIALKHTQEECVGFIDGFKEALSLFDVSRRSELLKAFVEFYNYRQNSDTRICYDEIDIYLDSL